MTNAIDKVFERAILVVAFVVGFFHLLNVSGIFVLSTRDIRIFHLMMMLVLLFLSHPAAKRFKDTNADRFLRISLIAISVASCVYLMTRWKDIAFSGGETVPMDAWVGIVVIALVLEAARRGVGLVLAIICFVFFAYPFYSPYLPGVLNGRGYSLTRMSEFLTTTSQGIFGIPLGVSSTYIILFSIYGAFLSNFGAGDFFFKLASRLTRGMRAAGAKTAVLFSTLLGMISGSAAGNVAVTGTLTIPMMKKEGYQPHQAGAIEAVVSTGGQIMPPVMGAAAFIMAEVVGTPYSNVMQAALIPALLFFTSLLFVVHLQAGKNGLTPTAITDEDDEPIWKILLKGGQYIVPFVTLITMMLNGYSPFKASFYSILVLLGCHVLWTRRINAELLTKSAKAVTEGAKAVVPIAIACAAAGIIAGTLGITGLGSKISGLIVSASGGVILIALLLTMLTAIILGMGLPTTAAYLVLATVVAPALAKMGVPLLTAHLFVFFYGCVSTITPPVALASYVAAGIAGADINRVGWTAFAFGITCYILPFMFVFGQALMMQGSWAEILLAVLSGGVGVLGIAMAVVGFAHVPLALHWRVLAAVAGIALLSQGWISDLVGLAAMAAVWFTSKSQEKGAAAAPTKKEA
ncbi:TRAP transporter 4TM/12TM fusion protein [Shimia isoporae]|uniref:TRAP transporter 4TM/12TM fusion protein n=1 Tax=Shimia isoporae TaxID=647720 RepID=A0A4R1NJA8_9RHOB|nr:TRAP transporter fused permease subunit [Shimia isoporae]TCL08336.1 TRAP transporter 4TM/12TM fusion protein [Shimia isoporae]